MPTRTAFWSGMIIVRTNVTVIAVAWVSPVFHTALRSWGLIVRYPTSIRSPASAGIAMYPTARLNRTMASAITTLATISASLDRAPADLTRELADIEPPTGIPEKSPDATLPAPWPMKSCDGSG